MTEPNRPDQVPAPPRVEDGSDETAADETTSSEQASSEQPPFADLEQRPVSEHVEVFEAEHGRLQRELGTIDRL